VAFPAAGRVAVVRRRQIFRMRSPVHEDRAKRVRAADVEDEDALLDSILDKLHTIWREELACTAGRFAASMRLELVIPAIGEQFFCPRLEWDLIDVQLAGKTSGRRNREWFGRSGRRIDQPFGASCSRKKHSEFARHRTECCPSVCVT